MEASGFEPFLLWLIEARSRQRAINLAAGAAALPLEVLEKASKGFVDTDHSGMSPLATPRPALSGPEVWPRWAIGRSPSIGSWSGRSRRCGTF